MRASRLVPLALLLAVLPCPGAAQALHGIVKDEATGQPVVAASVSLLSDRGKELDRVLTDSTGSFLLEPDEAGSYGLREIGRAHV